MEQQMQMASHIGPHYEEWRERMLRFLNVSPGDEHG